MRLVDKRDPVGSEQPDEAQQHEQQQTPPHSAATGRPSALSRSELPRLPIRRIGGGRGTFRTTGIPSML
jgi:hypothetical protein